MEKLIIDSTSKTPGIVFDPDKDKFEIFGRSLPDNVIITYKPLFAWIEENMPKIGKKHIVFNCRMNYLNSASTKVFSTFFLKLEKFYKEGANIEVKWYYTDEDDILFDYEALCKITTMPITLIPVDEL